VSVLDSIFSDVSGLVQQAGSLAPSAAAWKELIDPVKAVQQPTLGTATATPIIQPPPGGSVSKTPGQTTLPSMPLLLGGGAVLILLIVLLTRKT
jgi:hypothetical protein